jgi:hypothetical protein
VPLVYCHFGIYIRYLRDSNGSAVGLAIEPQIATVTPCVTLFVKNLD